MRRRVSLRRTDEKERRGGPDGGEAKALAERLHDDEVAPPLVDEELDGALVARGKVDVGLVDDDEALVVWVGEDGAHVVERDEGPRRVAGRAQVDELDRVVGLGCGREGAVDLCKERA